MPRHATRVFLTALSLLLLGEGVRADRLEVRVEPSEAIYVNQTARRYFVNDVMIQSIGIINRTDRPVTLKELVLSAGTGDEPLLTHRILEQSYRDLWEDIIFPLYSDPMYAESQDSITLLSHVIPEDVSLSPSLTLAPNTALMVTKRPLLLIGSSIPPQLRVQATAVDDVGIAVTGEATRRIERYRQKNEYVFPLRGRWYIASASSLHSHHRIRQGHEFALDLIRIGDGGSSFGTDGSEPEDYYAFGAEVVAIAAGKVVAAVGDIPETQMPRPGESREAFSSRVLRQMWTDDPTGRVASGNYVILEHEGGEYSFYVHLRNGSVAVREGETVRQGQKIGEVGISGDGYEPHLHFAVSNSPSTSYGQGLPVTFQNVRPVPFSSTLDLESQRLYLAGEFVETVP